VSQIRQLLAAAQEAEVKGELQVAIRLLQEAARWYEARNLLPRAAQMLRQVERLTAIGEVVRSPGRAKVQPLAPSGPAETSPEQVTPSGGEGPSSSEALASGAPAWGDRGANPSAVPALRAALELTGDDELDLPEPDRVWDLGVDEALTSSGRALEPPLRTLKAHDGSAAWCSFCCRPQGETGPLVAGPQGAGAFICAECLAHAAELVGAAPPPPAISAPMGALTARWPFSAAGAPEAAPLPPGPRAAASPAVPFAAAGTPEAAPPPSGPRAVPPLALIRQQALALERLEARSPRVALLLGPEGVGKRTLLKHLGGPHREPVPGASVLALELDGSLSPELEARLLAWLDAAPDRQLVLAARADAPAPVLVLQGPAGEERLYDTAALRQAVRVEADALLTRVELVLVLTPPTAEELDALAEGRLEARGVRLPRPARQKLVELSLRSAKPVSELLALVNRLPPGSYEAP
jgi:hypothetical protein